MNSSPSEPHSKVMIDLSTIADLVTMLAVVFGVIFGLVQLRQATRSRRDHAAVDIVRTVQTHEVRQAVGRILALPDDVDPDHIRGDPQLLAAALAVDEGLITVGTFGFFFMMFFLFAKFLPVVAITEKKEHVH